jgi:hypothetical protein
MLARSPSKLPGRSAFIALGVAVLCLLFSSEAGAQSYNKKTMVTFSAPVEIPGVNAQVLPAGTYVFRLLDSLSDRHIVPVLNKDENHIYATILAIPNYRLRATDKTVMTFAERRAGERQAIRAWFYPGDNSGQEFVYPKSKAVQLAKITNQPVLYIPDEVAANIIVPATTPTEPAVITLKEVPVRAVRPTGEDAALTEVVVPPPVQTAGLPKTGSDLPLLGLLALLCLGVHVPLRMLCARSNVRR